MYKSKFIEAHREILRHRKAGTYAQLDDCPLCTLSYSIPTDDHINSCDVCTLQCVIGKGYLYHAPCNNMLTTHNMKARIKFHMEAVKILSNLPNSRFSVRGKGNTNFPELWKLDKRIAKEFKITKI